MKKLIGILVMMLLLVLISLPVTAEDQYQKGYDDAQRGGFRDDPRSIGNEMNYQKQNDYNQGYSSGQRTREWQDQIKHEKNQRDNQMSNQGIEEE